MIGDTQRLKVRVEFEYDAEVFDGDPDDAFEIAKLEQGLAADNPRGVLPILLDEATVTLLEVEPVLVEEV